MNPLQMVLVLAVLSFLVTAYLGAIGITATYLEVLAGLAVLKGIALFLVPEKAPLVLVKSQKQEEDEY